MFKSNDHVGLSMIKMTNILELAHVIAALPHDIHVGRDVR